MSLTEADKRVVKAFVDERAADSRLLDSDGRRLDKLGLGGETVARWHGGRIVIVSTESVKSDESIIRAIIKVAGPGIVDYSYARKGHRVHDQGAMGRNARGAYHGLGPRKNDMVIHQDHRGRWRIDLITSASGTHQTIGTTQGFGGSSEAAREAGREAHIRGIKNGVLYRQEPDGSYGLHYEPGPDGRTARLRDLALTPNTRRKLLPSQRNEPGVRRDVLTDFMSCPDIDGTHTPEAFFEHDAWWVQCKCGAQWSVVDTNHGFDFEQVSHGDEEFHGASSDYENNGRRTGILSDGTRVNVYHQPGSLDEYTVVPHNEDWDSMERGGMRSMLGLSATGRGFSQWTEGQEGKHLGRSVPWDAVPDELKRHIEQRVVGETMVANASGSTVDAHAATELTLYIENEYALIGADNSIGKSIDTNLRKKVAAGKYDPALAPKAWQYLIDEGAKRYAKAYASPGDATQIFSAATRRQVATDFARAWEAENLTPAAGRS